MTTLPRQAQTASPHGASAAEAGSGAPLSYDEAMDELIRTFPFPGYVKPDQARLSFRPAADLLARHAPAGAHVLDFGSGPADMDVVLSRMGYRCTACDDLRDPWHMAPGAREKILSYAARHGVEFEVLEAGRAWPWGPESFDAVMLHHVLEHLHESPRELLNTLLGLLRVGGVLIVTVPNAVNLRKRLSVLRGRTNLAPYDHFYWHEGPWRGHVREFVRDDLVQLARYLGLELLEVGSYHAMIQVVPRRMRAIWKAVTALAPGCRDSWYLAARKPAGWTARLTLPEGDPVRERLKRIKH